MLLDKLLAAGVWASGAACVGIAGSEVVLKFQLALEHYAAVVRSFMSW